MQETRAEFDEKSFIVNLMCTIFFQGAIRMYMFKDRLNVWILEK
jgi:hypothetical protein